MVVIATKKSIVELNCDEVAILIASLRTYRLRLAGGDVGFDQKITQLIRERALLSTSLEQKLHALCD